MTHAKLTDIEGLTPCFPPENPPYEAYETDRWGRWLNGFESSGNHYVYVLECQRRPEYTGLTPDAAWGHPDYDTSEKWLIPHGDGLHRIHANSFHFRAVHPSGYPELAIPMWLFFALSADKVYYVGETPDIATRYTQHMNGESTQLFRFFEPTGRITYLANCLPYNPGDVERDVAINLTEWGENRYYVDWENISTFAYRGVSGRRYDTRAGWKNAPASYKNHPEWKRYWEEKKRGKSVVSPGRTR